MLILSKIIKTIIGKNSINSTGTNFTDHLIKSLKNTKNNNEQFKTIIKIIKK